MFSLPSWSFLETHIYVYICVRHPIVELTTHLPAQPDLAPYIHKIALSPTTLTSRRTVPKCPASEASDAHYEDLKQAMQDQIARHQDEDRPSRSRAKLLIMTMASFHASPRLKSARFKWFSNRKTVTWIMYWCK